MEVEVAADEVGWVVERVVVWAEMEKVVDAVGEWVVGLEAVVTEVAMEVATEGGAWRRSWWQWWRW